MNIKNNWFIGVVEAINDPLAMGRVKVRCYGYHNDDRKKLKTKHLPWVQCVFPVTSPSTGGKGVSPALEVDSIVFGAFYDGDNMQDAIILGTIPAGKLKRGTIKYDPVDDRGFGSLYAEEGPGIPDTGSTANTALEEATTGTQRAESANDPPPPPPTTVQSGAANKIAAAAESQVKSGEFEIEETSKNQGPGIEKFWKATSYGTAGYDKREPWCAAFLCWAVRESGTLPENKLPKSSGSSEWLTWAEKNSDIVEKRKFSLAASQGLQRGDILIRTPLKSDKDSPGGHISIVQRVQGNGSFTTIDGNYNDRVQIAYRNRSSMVESRFYVLRIKETGLKDNQGLPTDPSPPENSLFP